MNKKDSTEKDDLEESVSMNFSGRNVFGVWCLGILAGLLEEEKDTLPKVNSGQGRETHEQKDSQQDGERDLLDGTEEQKGKSEKQVREEVGQSRFLDLDDLSVLVFLGQVVQVNNARHGGGYEPWKTQKAVHHVGDTVNEKIPVVGLAVRQLVGGIVDQMPCDAVVKVKEDEGKASRAGG